jgi:conjugal transfer/type IV secretion protein DotA/TraY
MNASGAMRLPISYQSQKTQLEHSMNKNFADRFKPLLPWAALLAIMVVLFAVPQAAWATGSTASTTSQFQFASDDYFINVILKGILGNIINPTAASAGQTVSGAGTLGTVFKTFNMGVAFFGSVIVVFITLVGVLQSGNDGEFLGRKWSSMWVPVRFATGSALMLPLTSSGYSYSQAIVLWIASQGVGFADTLWTTIVNDIGIKNGMTLSKQIDVESVVKEAALAEICVATLNAIDTAANNGVASSPAKYGYKMNDNKTALTAFVPVRTVNAKWGDTSSLTNSSVAGACGSVNYSVNVNSNSATPNAMGMSAQNTNRLSDPYMLVRNAVADTHNAQIEILHSKFEPKAQAIVAEFMKETATANADPMTTLKPLFDAMFTEMTLLEHPSLLP